MAKHSKSRKEEGMTDNENHEWQVDRTSRVFRWIIDSRERCYRLYRGEGKWEFYRQSGNSLRVSTPDGVSWVNCDKCKKCKEYPRCKVWPKCPDCEMCAKWPKCSTTKELPENPYPDTYPDTKSVLSSTPKTSSPVLTKTLSKSSPKSSSKSVTPQVSKGSSLHGSPMTGLSKRHGSGLLKLESS